MQDETGGAVAADHVSLLPQGVEGGFEELRARSADAEGGLLRLVLDIIDLGLELPAQEADERVQLDALELHQVLGGQAAAAEQQGEQQGGEESSHGATMFMTVSQ